MFHFRRQLDHGEREITGADLQATILFPKEIGRYFSATIVYNMTFPFKRKRYSSPGMILGQHYVKFQGFESFTLCPLNANALA